MKSIWDVRFTKKKLAMDAAVKNAFVALDEWITIKGTHVELGDNGDILHGMGGKFKNVFDIPRKTVKQRQGESDEKFGHRAQNELAALSILTPEEMKQNRENRIRKEKKEAQKEERAKAFAENKSKRDKEMTERGKSLKAELKQTSKDIRELNAQIKRGEDGMPLSGQEDLVNKWENLVDKADKIDYQLEHKTYRYDPQKDAFSDLPEMGGGRGYSSVEEMHKVYDRAEKSRNNFYDGLNTDIALAEKRGDAKEAEQLKALGNSCLKRHDPRWWGEGERRSAANTYAKTGRLYKHHFVEEYEW